MNNSCDMRDISKLKQPSLLILPNGAIPMEFTQGVANPEVERSLYTKDSSMIAQLSETIILLQKNLRRVKHERDAYKKHVPSELLSRHTPSPTFDDKAVVGGDGLAIKITDAGQITDDS
jgi:hypothetical protein